MYTRGGRSKQDWLVLLHTLRAARRSFSIMMFQLSISEFASIHTFQSVCDSASQRPYITRIEDRRIQSHLAATVRIAFKLVNVRTSQTILYSANLSSIIFDPYFNTLYIYSPPPPSLPTEFICTAKCVSRRTDLSGNGKTRMETKEVIVIGGNGGTGQVTHVVPVYIRRRSGVPAKIPLQASGTEHLVEHVIASKLDCRTM